MSSSEEDIPSKKRAAVDSDSDYEDSKPAAKPTKKKAVTKKKKAPPTKCRKNNNQIVNNGEPLPLDALVNVMEYLHPRDLLNTASTCKWLLNAVTTPMVVRSAMIHGGLGKKSMEELHVLMSKHSMHVPSPLRLLRIANGKRCEFCVKSKCNHVRPGIGVFACWDCVTKSCPIRSVAEDGTVTLTRGSSLTKAWKTSWSRYRHNMMKYSTIFDHSRVGVKKYSKNYYMWNQTRTDRSGDEIGPIVRKSALVSDFVCLLSSLAFNAIDQICNHFKDVEAMNNAESGMDNYLTTTLNAPPVARYAEFNDTFTDMKAKADDAVIEREEKKKATAANTKEKKKVAAEKILTDVIALVDEAYLFALGNEANTYFSSKSAKLSTTPAIKMKTIFIDELLRPYILVPSKCKVKTKKEIATTINQKLGLFESKNLLALEFLSEDDAFEKKVKQRLGEMFPDVETLFSSSRIDDRFIEFLENDQLLDALGSLVGHNFSETLYSIEPSAAAITKAINTDGFDGEGIQRMIQSIWSKCLSKAGVNTYSWQGKSEDNEKSLKERYHEAFDASQTMFGEVLTALDEFKTFCSKKHESEERGIFNRNYVVSSYYYWENVLEGEEKFDDLDKQCDLGWERHQRTLVGPQQVGSMS